MGFIKEFREFAVKGNVIDMAVGIIIGAAFGKIVNSLVNDVLMPPLGWLTGGLDFKDKAWEMPLKAAEGKPVVMKYGQFINFVIEFTIVAFAVFLLVKGINALKRKQDLAPVAPPPPPADVVLLTEIRDLLQRQAR